MFHYGSNYTPHIILYILHWSITSDNHHLDLKEAWIERNFLETRRNQPEGKWEEETKWVVPYLCLPLTPDPHHAPSLQLRLIQSFFLPRLSSSKSQLVTGYSWVITRNFYSCYCLRIHVTFLGKDNWKREENGGKKKKKKEKEIWWMDGWTIRRKGKKGCNHAEANARRHKKRWREQDWNI